MAGSMRSTARMERIKPEAQYLFGSFRCRLTDDEINAWHQYLEQHPKYQQYEKLTIDIMVSRAKMQSHALSAEDLHNKCDIYREQLENALDLEREFFQIGQEWYQQNVLGKEQQMGNNRMSQEQIEAGAASDSSGQRQDGNSGSSDGAAAHSKERETATV